MEQEIEVLSGLEEPVVKTRLLEAEAGGASVTAHTKLEAIDRVWMMFTYQKPPQPGDAFHTVMRELARKRIVFKNSANRTWT